MEEDGYGIAGTTGGRRDKGTRASDGAREMCSAGGGAYENVFGAGGGAGGEGLGGNSKGGD